MLEKKHRGRAAPSKIPASQFRPLLSGRPRRRAPLSAPRSLFGQLVSPYVYLGKPKEILQQGAGAGILHLHDRNLVLGSHQDAVISVQDGRQIKTPAKESNPLGFQPTPGGARAPTRRLHITSSAARSKQGRRRRRLRPGRPLVYRRENWTVAFKEKWQFGARALHLSPVRIFGKTSKRHLPFQTFDKLAVGLKEVTQAFGDGMFAALRRSFALLCKDKKTESITLCAFSSARRDKLRPLL